MTRRTRQPQKKTPAEVVSQIEESGETTNEDKKERVDFLSSGSIMFNLALSQKAKDGGWGRGRIGNLVGDGSSGKTLSALEACAYAFYNIMKTKSTIFPPVKRVTIVYWNREGVMDFPLVVMYGESFVKGVEWSDNCATAEQWGRDVFRRLKAHKPGDFFLGVLDSIDSLGTEAGDARLAKSVKDDKPLDGTYGTGTERAKYFSGDFFNNLCREMRNKDFTLLLISQVREKINRMMFEGKYYRCGGKALDFYTHQVAWLAQTGKLDRTYLGEKIVYGVRVVTRIKRNKVAKPYREAKFTILFDYGMDSITSCVDFLYGPKNKTITWKGEEINTKDLIELADKNPEEEESITELALAKWIQIEEEVAVTRKPKFR